MADSTTKLLSSVDQFINDENKIVTYEFLSQSCGIHVNLAKNVLEEYAEKAKQKDPNSCQVVYSVGGYVGKNLRIFLVTDEKLKEEKSHLDRVLYSHVYSVQKGKLAGFSLLYNSNLTDLKRSIQQCNGHSSINFPAARLKTSEEVEAERPKVPAVKTTEPVAKEVPKVKVETAAEPKENANGEAAASEGNKSAESAAATAKTAPNKAGKGAPAIANFFAKHQVKDPEKKKKEEEAKAEANKKKSPVATSNKRIVREPSSDEEDEKEEESVRSNGHSKNGSSKRLKLAEEQKPEKSQPKSKGKPSGKANAKSSTSAAKPQRKRIQQFSDSESSDEGEHEDVMLSSPEMAIQPAPALEDDDEDMLEATQVEEPAPLKSKKRKLVSKTVMGEDGFVVTTKEFVTCDDDGDEKEPEPPAKKAAAPPPPAAAATKRPSPPGKGKQQSIMSFFQRK